MLQYYSMWYKQYWTSFMKMQKFPLAEKIVQFGFFVSTVMH